MNTPSSSGTSGALGATELTYEPKGGALRLWSLRDREVLIEGPAGTGKTRGVCELDNYLCETHPGIRVLWVRQDMASLRQSVQVTFEDKVLWPEHPFLLQGRSREHRSSYEYANGSEIVLGGLNFPERLFSTEYDLVRVFEAIETSLDAWEKLGRATRNGVLPWQQRLADTNPGPAFHWLNKRADEVVCSDPDPEGCRFRATLMEYAEGVPCPTCKRFVVRRLLRRVLSRHVDNPSLTPEYLRDLSNSTGARRARLYEGLWVSEEGQVWPEYDPGTHVIEPSSERLKDIRWRFASFDQGLRKPSCLQVWGVDSNDRMYRVLEHYRTGLMDQWADIVVDLRERHQLAAVVCDPAAADYISLFNDRLTEKGHPRIARPADNRRKSKGGELGGLDMVAWGFAKDLIFLVRGALQGRDPDLVAAHKPTCLEEEIPSYIWLKAEDGREVKEETDPACEDHACDATRYACMFAWRKDLEPRIKEPVFPPNSFGAALRHKQVRRNPSWSPSSSSSWS